MLRPAEVWYLMSETTNVSESGSATRARLAIAGMTCGHCVQSVQKALGKIGVKVIAVSIGSADVAFEDSSDIRDRIVRAVADAGYAVQAWDVRSA